MNVSLAGSNRTIAWDVKSVSQTASVSSAYTAYAWAPGSGSGHSFHVPFAGL